MALSSQKPESFVSQSLPLLLIDKIRIVTYFSFIDKSTSFIYFIILIHQFVFSYFSSLIL